MPDQTLRCQEHLQQFHALPCLLLWFNFGENAVAAREALASSAIGRKVCVSKNVLLPSGRAVQRQCCMISDADLSAASDFMVLELRGSLTEHARKGG